MPSEALGDYLQAMRLITADAAYVALDYLDGIYLVKPNVQGAGGNALYEYYWAGISIGRS